MVVGTEMLGSVLTMPLIQAEGFVIAYIGVACLQVQQHVAPAEASHDGSHDSTTMQQRKTLLYKIVASAGLRIDCFCVFAWSSNLGV